MKRNRSEFLFEKTLPPPCLSPCSSLPPSAQKMQHSITKTATRASSSSLLYLLNYFTIPSVRFSPSHTSSVDFSWSKKVGDRVECYNLLYTTTGYNVTIFCAPREGKLMEVECCEEGLLSWVRPNDPREEVEPHSTIGILASSEEEDRRIRELITGGGTADPVEVLRLSTSLEVRLYAASTTTILDTNF